MGKKYYLCIEFQNNLLKERNTIMAKKVKEITLFDNYSGYDFDEVKQELEECNECTFTDEQVWDTIRDYEEEDWRNAIDTLKDLCGDNKVIAYGSCGTWRGNFDASKMFDNIEKAIHTCVDDCDYIEIKVNAVGNIAVRATHHDGTNSFEIRVVTEKGENYFDKWNYSDTTTMTEYQVLEKIFGSKVYSKKVDTNKLF